MSGSTAGGSDQVEAIVLIGVSGSGKSTVGRRLATALAASFLEGDDYHAPASIAKMRSGTALSDADRWPWLDRLGQAVSERTAQGCSVVVACSALRRSYRARLTKAAGRPLIFIHLAIAPKILRARIQARRHHFMPPSLLRSQLETVEPLRPNEDGTTLIESGGIQQTIDAIRRWLQQRTVVTEVSTGRLD